MTKARPRATFHVNDPTAPTPNRPRHLGVAIALITRDGREVLLEHRSDSDLWGLVGGGVQEAESILTALHREITEETGRSATNVRMIGIFSDPSRITAYPDGNVSRVVTVAFVGHLTGGSPRPSNESTALQYFPWDEVPQDQIPATQEAILRMARDLRHGRAGRPPFVD